MYFIHFPKTAGQFMRSYCGHAGIHTHGHEPAKTAPKNEFKFGFVRNPWDWYVSRYFYFIKKDVVEAGVSKYTDAGLHSAAFEEKFPTFKDHMLYGIDNDEGNNFWMMDRYNFMFCDGDVNIMNYIGKMETINEDFENIYKLANFVPRVDMKTFNSGSRPNASKHDHYTTYYDQELIDLVVSKDKYIIEKYNYNFG